MRFTLLLLDNKTPVANATSLLRLKPQAFISFVGKTHDPEETVGTDYLTDSARKREFPEREKQFAHHASEGTGKKIFACYECKFYLLDATLTSTGERETGIFGREVCTVIRGTELC